MEIQDLSTATAAMADHCVVRANDFQEFKQPAFTGKSPFSWMAMDPTLFGNQRTKNQTDQFRHLATIHQHHTQIHTHTKPAG